MRFSLRFKIDNQVIPLDYRNGFLSLLKKCYQLASQNAFANLYDGNVLKPFTFSPYFGRLSKAKDGKVFLNTDTFLLNFSTSSLELGTYFYNGLLELKKELKEYNGLDFSDQF